MKISWFWCEMPLEVITLLGVLKCSDVCFHFYSSPLVRLIFLELIGFWLLFQYASLITMATTIQVYTTLFYIIERGLSHYPDILFSFHRCDKWHYLKMICALLATVEHVRSVCEAQMSVTGLMVWMLNKNKLTRSSRSTPLSSMLKWALMPFDSASACFWKLLPTPVSLTVVRFREPNTLQHIAQGREENRP